MPKALQRANAPLREQVEFWNRWNASTRETAIGRVSEEQADCISNWLRGMGRRKLGIIDVGCGAGWLAGRLTEFGDVLGVDLSHEVLERAARRVPSARFVAGDFMTMDLPAAHFDVAVSLEVLSHVADQAAFLARIASLLKPGGQLLLATQNRPALLLNDIRPPAPGQIRQWVDRRELAGLLSASFHVEEMFSLTPQFNRGVLRYLNSGRFDRALCAARLSLISRAIKSWQERAGLGWTLMARARRR